MKKYLNWYGKIVILSAILNLIIEIISRKSIIKPLVYMAGNPFALALNILIVALPFTLVFVVKRKIFLCILISGLWLLMGVANGILLIFRTTPFTASDLKLVKYASNMLTSYFSLIQLILLAGGISFLVFVCFTVWKKAPVDRERVRYGVGCLLVMVSSVMVVGTASACMQAGVVAVRFGNIGQAYSAYGFPYCFSNSLVNTGISKPEKYGSEAVETIAKEEMLPSNTFSYTLGDGVKPNIVMVQLESFFDPTLWNGNTEGIDPVPYFRYLTETYPSGYLSVPSVGAGTANTEFEVITGMNLDFFGPGEYPYKTVLKKTVCESAAFNLKEMGYRAHAIHNNEGTFYDRHYVFSQLGFDTFTPIEYMYDIVQNPMGWCQDQILTGEIKKTLDSTVESDFIYGISVQGHGAYPDFAYYCSQIGEMDSFLRGLIRELGARREPTVLVLYGDHLPGFEWEETEMENGSLYQTQYVIWNNLNLPNEKKDVEAYQLSAYVMDLLGIHQGTMMRFHQKYFNDQDYDEDKYLEDMQVLEYDILYGDREVYGKKQPYEATDLSMGITPIIIRDVVYNSGNLLVFGSDFNTYSKICIDGKPVDTMYVWPELLVAKDVAEKKIKAGEICVRQIGRDKVALGEAVTWESETGKTDVGTEPVTTGIRSEPEQALPMPQSEWDLTPGSQPVLSEDATAAGPESREANIPADSTAPHS